MEKKKLGLKLLELDNPKDYFSISTYTKIMTHSSKLNKVNLNDNNNENDNDNNKEDKNKKRILNENNINEEEINNNYCEISNVSHKKKKKGGKKERRRW